MATFPVYQTFLSEKKIAAWEKIKKMKNNWVGWKLHNIQNLVELKNLHNISIEGAISLRDGKIEFENEVSLEDFEDFMQIIRCEYAEEFDDILFAESFDL